MRPQALALILLLTLFGTPSLSLAQADPIQRIDPPNWWTGFYDTQLQLMITGSNVASYRVSVDHGARVLRTVTLDSPNYLFVYLDLADAVPGDLTLRFHRAGDAFTRTYRLAARNANPKTHAQGFSNRDAIYLVTPDRFANGNTSNDRVAGLGDLPDRSKPGGRHGGDIAGLSQHLDYIRDMGFTQVWLNPVLENAMPDHSYHGYATTDFYRVDPRYGSNDEYFAFAQKLRAQGMGLIMDMIVNHSGSAHPWLADLPSHDWINQANPYAETTHERTVLQDPYAAPADIAAFSDGWFVPSMPDLNQRQPQLADYLVQNALWWIEQLGLAGIRMDTYPYPDKTFMTRWTKRVMQEYPAFNIVGEEWSLNPAVVSYWQRGKVNHDGYVSYLPSLMDFPNLDALRLALTEPEQQHSSGLMRLHRMLANDVLYPEPNALVIFADNHDMSRIHTQLGEDLARWKMAMAWLATMRGVPQIYYGTEILMTNPGTDDHGIIRSDFPGGFGARSPNAFTGRGLAAESGAAQSWLRDLLRWRRTASAVHSGTLTHFVPRNGVYAFARSDGAQTVFVLLNRNADELVLPLDRFADVLAPITRWRNVLSGSITDRPDALTLPGPGPYIFETAPER